jgi:hypothetical protein
MTVYGAEASDGGQCVFEADVDVSSIEEAARKGLEFGALASALSTGLAEKLAEIRGDT